jgi:hypothetical protein
MGRRWIGRAALALLALVLAVAACTSPLGETAARKAATDYFMTAPHEGDNPPADVVITSIQRTTHEARSGWEVAINGRIVLAGLPDGYLSAMILFVDESSGQVTVIAQG